MFLKGIRAAIRIVRSPGRRGDRSPARPNPLGLHPVTVREIDGTREDRTDRAIVTASAFDDTSGANFPLRVRHRVWWRVPLPRNPSCRYSMARRW